MPERKIKRMNINLPADLHDSFKAAAASRGETMTVALMRSIKDYIANYGVAPAPKKKGRRQ